MAVSPEGLWGTAGLVLPITAETGRRAGSCFCASQGGEGEVRKKLLKLKDCVSS